MDCSQCKFRIIDNNKQVGCQAERIDKFIDNGTAVLNSEHGCYELKQFCNMYVSDDNDLIDREFIRNKIKPLFGIVIHLTSNDTAEQATKACEHIKSLNYPQEKVKVVISAPKGLKYAMHLVNLAQMLRTRYGAAELVLHLHDEKKARDNETFSKLVQATYFVKMGVHDRLDLDIFEKIDHLINSEMKQVCFIENNSVNIVLKSSIQYMYYNYGCYDETVEGLKTISVEQDKYERL